MKRTLNVGCGDRTFDEYPPGYTCINFDERETLKSVDVVGDVRDLSRFNSEEFDYILASDILEHFNIGATASILNEWANVLKLNGTLELRVPNFEAIIRHYKENNNMQHVSWMLMGGQDYPGNYHFVVFNEKWLREICESVDLEFQNCIEEGPNLIMKVKKI